MISDLGVVETVSDLLSVLFVSLTVYLGLKIVRLSREIELVALRGRRAPYYIVLGVFFLAINRALDLFAETYLSSLAGEELAAVMDDPPGAVAAFFIFLGLRNMYVLYTRKKPREEETAEDLWVNSGEVDDRS